VGSLSPRPRLLFLCQTLPFPPDGGVWIRTYHVLRLLARAFDITALCFERAGTAGPARDVAASRAALSRFADVEVFAIPQRHSRLRYAWDHARSAARGRVYTTYLYESRVFRRRLARLLETKAFDLVHADSLDLATYLPACQGLPVVCVHHDVESALLRRRAALERSRWRRAYLAYQARLMEGVERYWCERVALNVAVSGSDAAVLNGRVPAARLTVVPNGVDMDEFQSDGTAGTGVAFVGGTNPFPNLDALDFFCGDILPRLRATGADVPVRWIGRASSEQRQAYLEGHGIELTGYVDDVRPLMRDAACHIVPLRVGGGTRLKILNSWAMGKAVVSTSIGCEGLAATDGVNVLIRDEPSDFATAILQVLRDDHLRRRLGEAGRATAQRLYGWDVVGQHMIDVYRGVARAPRACVSSLERGSIRAQPRYSQP
jgi:glycosyltransferase involved in cell wall biosynthesis